MRRCLRGAKSMSEHGVHTHAPHEEAILHGGEVSHLPHPGLGQWVAIFTAILAAFGALVSYQGNRLMNEVLLYKNEAVLYKAQATDQWNYYQAVSTKAHLAELASVLDPRQAGQYQKKIRKYKAQKVTLRKEAGHLDQESTQADQTSAKLNRPHTSLEISLVFLQIAISIASITALTRKRWLFAVGIFCAVAGVALWGQAVAIVL